MTELELPEVKATRQLHDAAMATGMDHQTIMGIAGIFKRLNDAEAERDAALAVIEQLRALREEWDAAGRLRALARDANAVLDGVDDILCDAPASALAKVKADAWQEGAEWGDAWHSGFSSAPVMRPIPRENPYRTEAS